MPRNFKLPAMPRLGGSAFTALKDTGVRIRIGLGVLLLANLVAAAFALHLFDDSPEQLSHQVISMRQQILSQMKKLSHTRQLAGKVEKGRDQDAQFISTYMTNRRSTYSTIATELDQMASQTGMKSKDSSANLEAIPGTDALDMLTVTASFEGDYKNLLQFMNLIDRSKRFLIIETLAVSPQQNLKLQVTMKLHTFVKEDLSAL